ncbi:MAG: YbfB/YjiJ family MFS transporter [Burkholderiales bacterium]|nr:YbfB/YjiJ family MFS transporter [Burkholderiales bacterium]
MTTAPLKRPWLVLAGGSAPLMLDTWGPASWPAGWLAIGAVSVCALPLSLWAASRLHAPVQQAGQARSTSVPVRRMLPVLACYASGLPLALIVACVAIGTALPVVLPKGPVLLVSAVVFGISVFMQPGAGTNFVRQNLPPQAWGSAMSLMTLIFAVTQIAGPYGAGLVADRFGDIGISLLAAAGVLLIGAALVLLQRPLQPPEVRAR